jgi:RNA polymerase sigma-32 factor
MKSMMKTLPVVSGVSADAGLANFLQIVNAAPMLTADEEKSLARRYRNEEDLDAARQLIYSHMRFVVRTARGFTGYGLPLADLIQEGNIGLMKAVKNYEPDRGVRLVSFAMHWIRSEIYDYILKNWRIVKVATTKAQRKLFFNLRKSRKRLGWMNENDIKTLSDDLDVPEKTVLEMESRMSGVDVSFDMDSDSDDDTNYVAPAGYIADNRYNPENLYEKDTVTTTNNENLSMALAGLDERSQDIVKQRWLNPDDKKATLTELAEKHGVSAERIRQIEKKAFKQMKGELIA